MLENYIHLNGISTNLDLHQFWERARVIVPNPGHCFMKFVSTDKLLFSGNYHSNSQWPVFLSQSKLRILLILSENDNLSMPTTFMKQCPGGSLPATCILILLERRFCGNQSYCISAACMQLLFTSLYSWCIIISN